MCKTKLHKKQEHGKTHGKTNGRKETVQQLSESMPPSLNIEFFKEPEKKLRRFLTQLSNHIILLKRVNTLALRQPQLLNLNHPRPKRAITQRQLVLPHEILRFLPLPTIKMKQKQTINRMILLQHSLDS